MTGQDKKQEAPYVREERPSDAPFTSEGGPVLRGKPVYLLGDRGGLGPDGVKELRRINDTHQPSGAQYATRKTLHAVQTQIADRVKQRSADQPKHGPDREFLDWAARRDAGPQLAGMDAVNGSGSNQFSASGLQWMRDEPTLFDRRHLVIVDLRQEPHAHLGDWPATWIAEHDVKDHARLGATPAAAQAAEEALVRDLLARQTAGSGSVMEWPVYYASDRNKKGRWPLWTPPAKPVKFSSILTEADLVHGLIGPAGHHYLRLHAPDHEIPERDAVVDTFVAAVMARPNAWFHFHCRGGKGRTTTFMCMYDALRNADKQLDGFDVIYRQWMIGGSDLDSVQEKIREEGLDYHYKTRPARDRVQFVRKFVEYATATAGATPWSVWAREHGCALDDAAKHAQGDYAAAPRQAAE